MTRMMKSFVRFTMYFMAACVIIVAVAVIISRAMVPILDNHKADFEKWAGDLLGYPVKIEKVRLGWYQYQPEITLRRVAILDKETRVPLQKIKRVSVYLSLPQSLIERKPIPSGVMLSGAVVSVEQAESGEYTIKGLSFDGLTDQSTETSKMTEALNWLSKQPRLILREIDIHFSNARHKKYDITLADLRFQNDGSNHDVMGKAILHQTIPTKVDVAIQWQGEQIDPAKISANVYLYVSGFAIGAWKSQLPDWQQQRLDRGIVSAKIWGAWHQGTFTRLQMQCQGYDLAWHSLVDKTAYQVNRISAHLGWKREGLLQVLAGSDILIDLPDHLWPLTSFYLTAKTDEAGQLMPVELKLGFVDLKDTQTFALSWLPVETQKILKQLAISGSMQNMTVLFPPTWQDWHHISLDGTLADISVSAYENFPSVEHLTADVAWKDAQGVLTLNTHQGIFQANKIFARPIDLELLTGNINFAIQPNYDWQMTTNNLHLANADIDADVKMSLSNTEAAPLLSDITGTFTLHQAKNITKYLPMKHFDQPLNEWLTSAFLSGYVKNGQAIVRGPLKDYPFDQGNGLFKISGDVKGVDFKFAPDWPMLEGVDAKLTFEGRHIIIDTEKASSVGVELGQLHGVIPYLGDEHPQVLQVDTVKDVNAHFTQAFSYINASPLKKTIGKMFNGIQFSGPLNLKLGLTIPLKDPDQTAVKGDLDIKNADMNLVPWHLKINQLSGLVHFTEKTTTADAMQARIFNRPLQFSLATVQKTKTISVVRANIANQLSIADIEAWLDIPFSKVVSGTTDIKGELDFSLDVPMEIHLRSDLVGIKVDLPDQFGKKAEEARAFTADFTIQDKQPVRAQMRYGDLLGAALILEKKNNEFALGGVNLRLGQGIASFPPTDGLYITGQWKELNWDQVKGYLNQSGNSKLPPNFLKKIELDIQSANLFGQQLSPLHVAITPLANQWSIELDAPGISGDLVVPTSLDRHSQVTADFQQLQLSTSGTGAQTKIDTPISALPPINFRAQAVQVGTLPLGQVTFKTSPSGKGMRIDTLTISSQYANLQAIGSWVSAGNGYMTQLQGTASSNNVSELLTSYGFNVHNFISKKGQVNFQLAWLGAPFAPNLASLNGSASLDISKGRIVDIGETSGAKMDLGKMLSLFSLQTIPRRLSLDFSDLFLKGYSFDYLKGDFVFQNGNLLTNNTRFEGPVARVGIDGRIGLVRKDYDLRLSVTPYITSSIPVAAALVTLNPLVGVGAYAVSKVVAPGVAKATMHEYLVTGPWNNPTWRSP